MQNELKISGIHYQALRDHLFPGDGKEAVAIACCGRNTFDNKNFLLVHKLTLIPYDHCFVRESDQVNWSTSLIEDLLIESEKKGWAIVKFHSHPSGFRDFSQTDCISDRELFSSVYGWIDGEGPHASVVMLPDGFLFGRVITSNLKFIQIDRISVIGDDLQFFHKHFESDIREFERRTAQTFGAGTTKLLNTLKIGVVGCSGTGSPVVEQIVRLGVGEIVLVDPDVVEEKNLNRILNTTKEDAKLEKKKVEVLKDAIIKMDLGTKVKAFSENIYDNKDVIYELNSCDLLFGCVDSVDGRHLLNQISTFYLIPYLDLGVKLIADGKGGIDQICGTIHYLQAGGGSLQSRGVYNSEELRAASMYRTSIEDYEEQKKSGYITNVNVDSPAVISVNMQIASMAVNEFLARIHPFRHDDSREFAVTRLSLSDGYIQYEEEGDPDEYLLKHIGKGTIQPLLNMPELS